MHNAEVGAATGPAKQQALAQAASDLLAGGVTLGAGAAHVWDLPTTSGTFTLNGNACARIIYTDRNGAVLRDVEFFAEGSNAQAVPANTAMTVVECLGTLPSGTAMTTLGFGIVNSTYAASGDAPVVGWQASSTLLQIGPTRFAARGASVRVTRAYASQRNGRRASYGTPQAADVVRGQKGVETQLPASIDVVMIALDSAEPGMATSGDLAIGISGGTLATRPQRVATGMRRLLIYDVIARDANASSLTISVASESAWTFSGVVGMHGTALEWATSLRSGIPDHFVPEGPVAPGGSLTVTYAIGAAS